MGVEIDFSGFDRLKAEVRPPSRCERRFLRPHEKRGRFAERSDPLPAVEALRPQTRIKSDAPSCTRVWITKSATPSPLTSPATAKPLSSL